MIPELIIISGSPWAVLPEGIHLASLSEVEAFFATNPHRRALYNGLIEGLKLLQKAGCQTLYLDGSFVTGKPRPEDYDACWEKAGIDPRLMHPVFFDFDNKRENQKRMFQGEYFPASAIAQTSPSKKSFLQFFQVEKYTGMNKGILQIDLRGESFN